jgi:hypothetical protein
MDEMEAVGEAVTGGLLARAVEPQAGEAGADGHTHEKNCLNCGTRLTGAYCSACGQKAHVHRSVRAFFADFVQGLFNFEGKIWRTLPMLAWCPGLMTRRYIAGERARFISPVALYLFTVFAMFATLNLTGALNPGSTAKNMKDGLRTAIAADRQDIVELQAKRKAAVAAGKSTANIDRKITKRQADIAESQKVLNGQLTAIADADDEGDAPDWLRPFIQNVQANPDMVSMKIQDAASKYSWLLIPLSVPFMWLLFPFRRRYNTYDHTVFVTYSLSFMMMLVIVAGLLVAVGLSGWAGLLFFVPPFHMYRHLKQSYQLGRFSAIMRTMALVTFAFIAASLFAAATVAIGAM